jgi:hypothetical protein
MAKDKTQSRRAEPAASRKGKPTKMAVSSVQRAIGNRLRAYYDGVAKEPIPDRFLELLKQLDAKDPGK